MGDAAANSYLAFAAILAAGSDGIERGLTPPAPLAAAEPRSGPQLPSSLAAALDLLQADDSLTAGLGAQFVRIFTSLKRQEIARFDRAVTDWEFNEYSWLL